MDQMTVQINALKENIKTQQQEFDTLKKTHKKELQTLKSSHKKELKASKDGTSSEK